MNKAEYGRRYYWSDPEYHRKDSRDYYEKNRDAIAERRRRRSLERRIRRMGTRGQGHPLSLMGIAAERLRRRRSM